MTMSPPRESFHRFALGCWIAAMVAVALLSPYGCSKAPSTFTPAITSSVPAVVVLNDAARWAAADPSNRYFATTANTHSMEPFFTNHSVPLCMRYTGQPIPNGTVAIFNRGDQPRVMHVVSDQTADSVYMSGYNNHASDGWFPKTRIEGLVVGQLYLP